MMLLEISDLTLQIVYLLTVLTVRPRQHVKLRFVVDIGDALALILQILLSSLQCSSHLLILFFLFTQLLFLLL